MSLNPSEKTPLLGGEDDDTLDENGIIDLPGGGLQFRAYKRRWYIVSLFAAATFAQGLVWNTFGPIERSMKLAFGWGSTTIALLPNWGGVMYILCFPLAMYITNTKGLRVSVAALAFFIAAGTSLRCIRVSDFFATISAHICAILNGIGGSFALSMPTVLSSTWFKENERTTATAISTVLNYIGMAMSFVLGPEIVADRVTRNATNITTDDVDRIRNNVYIYMYALCAFSVLIFVTILIYFPAKPPLPPSRSAATGRVSLWRGSKIILKNKNFWLLLLPTGMTAGVYSGFSSVLCANLDLLRVDQDSCGWIGFISTMSGCLAGLAMGQIADHIQGHMKALLLVVSMGSAIAFAWLTCIIYGVAPSDIVAVYASNIMGGLLINSGIPLYYELACETCYPVSEVVVNGIMGASLNFFIGIFLSIALIPGIGTRWMNPAMCAICLMCLPCLIIYKERYNRLNVDQNINQVYDVTDDSEPAPMAT